MIYEVYANLCDIRVGSYVTLGTKAAQSYYIYTYHWDDTCQIFLYLVYEFIRIFLKKFPFLAPFWGWGHFSFSRIWNVALCSNNDISIKLLLQNLSVH